MVAAAEYAITKRTNLPYEEAVEQVRTAFKEQGFGVLTEIDVQKTLKEKTGADFRKYLILGTCNPQLAHRALLTEPNIGVLLPCNVAVYEDGKGSVIAAQSPIAGMQMIGNPDLAKVAEEATRRIRLALDRF